MEDDDDNATNVQLKSTRAKKFFLFPKLWLNERSKNVKESV